MKKNKTGVGLPYGAAAFDAVEGHLNPGLFNPKLQRRTFQHPDFSTIEQLSMHPSTGKKSEGTLL